jgi:hypothetical protein
MAEIPERWKKTYDVAREYYQGRSNIEKVLEELGTAEARIRELESENLRLREQRDKAIANTEEALKVLRMWQGAFGI